MIKDEKILTEFRRLNSENISKELLMSYFVDTMKHQARFKMDEKFHVDLTKWGGKGTKISQIGRYLYNVLMNEADNKFFQINGYVDIVQGGRGIGSIDEAMGYALKQDVLSSDEYIAYVEKRDWMGYLLSHWILPSMTSGLTTPLPEITKMKEELFIEYAEELKANPIVTASKIEGILIKRAKELLKGDVGMDIFDSGARGSFGNNYKNVNIMRGVISDPADKNKIKTVSSSSLSEGIKKEEFSHYANILIQANAARSLLTQKGGYLNKLYSSTYQSVVLGEAGSDCKTTSTQRVVITSNDVNKDTYLYRYIVDGGKLVLLDKSNSPQYIGKSVKMRSPLYCADNQYCSKCAGDLYFTLGVKNIGLLLNRPAGILMNLSMKSFHNLTLQLKKIDIWDMID